MFVKKGAEFMLFTFEDALQIHHAKCEKIEVYKLQTRRKRGPGLA